MQEQAATSCPRPTPADRGRAKVLPIPHPQSMAEALKKSRLYRYLAVAKAL